MKQFLHVSGQQHNITGHCLTLNIATGGTACKSMSGGFCGLMAAVATCLCAGWDTDASVCIYVNTPYRSDKKMWPFDWLAVFFATYHIDPVRWLLAVSGMHMVAGVCWHSHISLIHWTITSNSVNNSRAFCPLMKFLSKQKTKARDLLVEISLW